MNYGSHCRCAMGEGAWDAMTPTVNILYPLPEGQNETFDSLQRSVRKIESQRWMRAL